MFEAIAVVLVLLWALGFFGAHIAMGGLIHLLLVLAVVAIVFRVIQGRRL